MDVKRSDSREPVFSSKDDDTAKKAEAGKAKKSATRKTGVTGPNPPANPNKNVDAKVVRSQHQQEVQDLEASHREKVNELQDRHSKQLTAERIQQKNSLETQRKNAQQSYVTAAQEQSEREANQRAQAREHLRDMDQHYTEQHKAIEAQRQEDMQVSQEALRSAEMDNKQHGDAALKEQREGYRKNFETDQAYFEDYRTAQRENYGDQIKGEKEYFKDAVKGREGEYENRYNENEVRYQMTLEDQRIKYEKAYEKAKYDHLEKMKRFESGEKDPFYRVQDLGAKFTSDGPFYQVAIPVPEHELKNFKVHVQPDRIVISDQRKFEDEKKYAGEKVATNNYQTVRQEFSLPTPADKDLVRREYQNGVLFVTAPKKGFGIIR